MQNKHGPLDGLMQGMQSNRGSPVHTGANAPPDLNRKGRYRRRWLMSRKCSMSDHSDSTPFMIIVKPPGQGFLTRQSQSQNHIVQGLPVLSQPGCPGKLPPLLTQTPAGPALTASLGETRHNRSKGSGLTLLTRLKAKG